MILHQPMELHCTTPISQWNVLTRFFFTLKKNLSQLWAAIPTFLRGGIGRIFLWIWLNCLTQILSPSWNNNHHYDHFGKNKHKLWQSKKLFQLFFAQDNFQWKKSSESTLFLGLYESPFIPIFESPAKKLFSKKSCQNAPVCTMHCASCVAFDDNTIKDVWNHLMASRLC